MSNQFSDMFLIQEAICQSCAPEYLGYEFDYKSGMKCIRELLIDCILWHMGSVPLIPKRVLRSTCSEETVTRYFSLRHSNPIPALYADTFMKNPHLFSEDVLCFVFDLKRFNCTEFLKECGYNHGAYSSIQRYSDVYGDLSMLYAKVKYDEIFHNNELASEEKLLHKIHEISKFWNIELAYNHYKNLKDKRLTDIIELLLE